MLLVQVIDLEELYQVEHQTSQSSMIYYLLLQNKSSEIRPDYHCQLTIPFSEFISKSLE